MHRRTRAFSLVELVIVVTILGIIAAIAVPRMSRGAKGAADSKIKADLAIMRSAINMYAAEHDGAFPTAAKFVEQMTTYTNLAGGDNATAATTHPFGPYLEAIPTIRVGAQAGNNGVAAADAAGVAWIYTEATGTIKANVAGTIKDGSGVAYADY